MDVSSLLDDLNEAQRDAVSADPINQLVLAGAGSGKTRVLVHRIAWMIQVNGLSPHQILAVTFTNKAAREMRERLSEILKDSEHAGRVRSMWVGTFHGIAHRLLKLHYKEANLPQNFQILDSDDQLRVVKRVYQSLNVDENRWPYKQTQWFINGQKDEGVRAKYIQEGNDPYKKQMKELYLAYEDACNRAGVVDFAELLLRAHELWLNNKELLDHYQSRFRCILVDEFQDTNTIQYAWLRVLSSDKSAITAVGDDDQSIYGWRGAKVENIQQYQNDFDKVHVTRLEQNYRSTGTILDAANAVISNNTQRLGKKLWTSGQEGEPIDVYAAFNEQDEARYIVERIKDWVDKGNAAKDCAVLYRSNAQSRVLEEAFLREGMPYQIYGGQRFYERLEIKNALAYLRLLLNRDDDPAFERVINTPTRGIGARTLETIRLTAREEGSSLYEALDFCIANQVFSARASNALLSFRKLLQKLEADIDRLSLHDQIEHVIEHSGLRDFHGREKGETGQTRLENLGELVNAARGFTPVEKDFTPLQEFLDSAALDAGDRQADEYEDAVQMMTLHSAKGLEFPLVFLAGLEENLFPHKMSKEDPNGLEEERRLCYVGITRAMQKCVITYAEARRLHGTDNFNMVSRFVREIPKELLREVRIKSTVSRPSSFVEAIQASDINEDFGIKLGQLVEHPMFGEGTVMQFEGQGSNTRVQVNFGSEGSKWLVLQYAKLKPL